jgi:methionine synthase II (cobalamin-independent)
MLNTQNLFVPLAVGSFPHKEPESALALIFKYLPRIPLWPQLPQKDFRESMYIQYCAGMPSIIIDEKRQRIYMDTSSSPEADLGAFYEGVLEEKIERFAFSPVHAAGFYAFLSSFKKLSQGGELYIKGQVTGPFSFGLTVTDEQDRPIIYNQTYYEAVVAAISLHAKWQTGRLKELHPRVLIFIDEPYLASYGSALVSVGREVVVQSINMVIDRIHEAGAIAGVHCCGNTDWSAVLETNLDLLNFDAYQFFDNVILYGPQLKNFLGRGGVLAWGIVPSSEAVLNMTAEELISKLHRQLEALAGIGVDLQTVKRNSFISPACGLGSQSIAVAESALEKLNFISDMFAGVF